MVCIDTAYVALVSIHTIYLVFRNLNKFKKENVIKYEAQTWNTTVPLCVTLLEVWSFPKMRCLSLERYNKPADSQKKKPTQTAPKPVMKTWSLSLLNRVQYKYKL